MGRDPQRPGYGTYPGSHAYEGIERYETAVRIAIRAGFRHIDTAQAYDNEQYVGRAIRTAEIPRDEIFLTTKLDSSANSRNGARAGLTASLEKLGAEFVDLFLVHYPGEGNPIGAWEGLLDAKADGRCTHIGVSNFEVPHLQALQELTGTLPEVNQIEFHPLLHSRDLSALVDFCHEHGIEVEGYCPLAWGELLMDEVVRDVARQHEAPVAHVLLKWCIQHGVRPVVGGLNPQHIMEDAGPFPFELTADELRAIDGLGRRQLRLSERWGWNPPSIHRDTLERAYRIGLPNLR